MPQLIRLRGRSALSAFRLQKLLQTVSASLPEARISAEFWHFASVSRALSEAELKRLERILTYGPAAGDIAAEGQLLLVLPRIGTISPWASKAIDIARHCGLEAVERIERGIAFRVAHKNAHTAALTAEHKAALLPLIHDRMTQTVLESFDAVAQLFRHFDPRPLATIDLLGGGAHCAGSCQSRDGSGAVRGRNRFSRG